MTNDEMKRNVDKAAAELIEVIDNMGSEDSQERVRKMLDSMIQDGHAAGHLALMLHIMMLQTDGQRSLGELPPPAAVLLILIEQVGADMVMEALTTNLTHSMFRLREYAIETGQLEALKYSMTRQGIEETGAINRARMRKRQRGNDQA